MTNAVLDINTIKDKTPAVYPEPENKPELKIETELINARAQDQNNGCTETARDFPMFGLEPKRGAGIIIMLTCGAVRRG